MHNLNVYFNKEKNPPFSFKTILAETLAFPLFPPQFHLHYLSTAVLGSSLFITFL